MSIFRYNSYHKAITVVAIILWIIFHFSGTDNSGKHFDNGQLKRSGSFSNGKNQGKWTWYYENGNKKMEGSFINGKRNGEWITWSKSGRKLTQGHYENDRLNGEFIRWGKNQKIIEQLIYKDDVLIRKIKIIE